MQCLDAFGSRQSRLVVIVDGLDSCQQDQVLHVLDAIHLLFSDEHSPFIVILAIDPHIVIKVGFTLVCEETSCSILIFFAGD